uniref:Apple domain-containing protein n=1 Tax=Meloidogyne enterolobii TaxID=390850 RepID=A0A6V7VBQ1_MELEN|nr:unnamed protein product [Meloidogyne enterolobii]
MVTKIPTFPLLFIFPLLFTFLTTKCQAYSIPLISECNSEEAPVFLLQRNVSSIAGTEPLRTVPVTGGFLECAELCSAANNCVAVKFSIEKQCQLLGKTTTTTTTLSLQDINLTQARLATKSCVKSKKICSSPFHFDVHEQKILVGFAREVVSAESIHQCLTACLDAVDTFGFECESVMYYPLDAECILNTEDRLDRPDLFVDEKEDTVIYLDNNCAGSQCHAPYVTQYVAVEGKQLAEELDHNFDGMELTECEQLCNQRLSVSANDFNCKAFMYNNQTRSCILSDERSRPLGRANLTDAKGWTYHEKKCFASPRTCRNVPSFTRVPQMLLVGFASFVMENVPSVTMCLDQCTNPPPETGQSFVCKSVMYYYNEQECILNAESRHSKPDLFIPEEDDFVVDYFDINCRLEQEQCIDGRTPQLVRTINSALPEGEGSIHVLETIKGGVQQCAKKCFEHAPDKCRSFNFDKQAGNCNLLYLDGQGSLRPEQKTQFDLYDVHCLSGTSQLLGENSKHSPSACVDPEGAIFSRFLYTRWVANSPNREISSLPLSKCLNLCSTGGEQCEGVNYNRRNGSCQLFTSLLLNSSPNSQQDKDEHVDFYRNICRVKESKSDSGAANVPKTQQATAAPPPSVQLTTKPPQIRDLNNNNKTLHKEPNIKLPPKSKNGGKTGKEQPPVGSKSFGVTNTRDDEENSITGTVSSPVDGKLIIKPSPQVSIPSPVLIPAQEVHTICNYEGISVQIKHSSPFSGVVFVRNKYDTCRVEVEGKDSVVLVLGLPANFGMKPIALINSQKHGKGNKTHGDTLLSIEGSKKQIEGGSSTEDIHLINSQKDLKRSRRQLQRDCGLQDMDNGTYKTVIVVQTNNLGIPGLVTSMDQLYESFIQVFFHLS